MSIEQEHENKDIVQSVSRALTLLEALARDGAELTLTDLVAVVDLHPSTTHRLLNTLVHRGFVQKNEQTRRYRLSIKMLEISRGVDVNSVIRAAAEDLIHQLAIDVGETVNLVIPDGPECVIVARAESRARVRYSVPVGTRLPMHCTAAGKVLLAHLPKQEMEFHLRGELAPFTPNSITDRYQLARELERCRDRGYAIDNEEHEVSLRCVAAPIRDTFGRVLGSVSISGPVGRMTQQRLAELGEILQEVTQTIASNFNRQT